MDQFLSKAVAAGATATIADTLRDTRSGLRIRYAGLPNTFVVEDLRIDGQSCFAAAGEVAAETLAVEWTAEIRAGASVWCRIRNDSDSPATFVALIADV